MPSLPGTLRSALARSPRHLRRSPYPFSSGSAGQNPRAARKASRLLERCSVPLAEDPVAALSCSDAAVRCCSVSSPALLLCLSSHGHTARISADTGALPSQEPLFRFFDDYAARQQDNSEVPRGNSRQHPQRPERRAAAEGKEGRRGERREVLLSTASGAQWAVQQSDTHDAAAQRSLLQHACQADECPEEVVAALTRRFFEAVHETPGGHAEFEELLSLCLARATPLHVASIVSALQCVPPAASTPSDASRLAQWDSRVTPKVAKCCLQRVAAVVRERRGAEAALFPYALSALHRCAMCTLPSPRLLSAPLRADIAALSMSALKYASYPQLRELFAYLESAEAVSPSVLNRFLANCGMLVGLPDPMMRSERDWGDCGDVVARAVRSLAKCGRNAAFIEEGLVHGCSVLASCGYDKTVESVYAQFPTSRVTPHLVTMYVSRRDVRRAVRTLRQLADSHPEGWMRTPPAVQCCITCVCQLVGTVGLPRDVRALYEAVVSFHNAGMLVSQCVESVMAGVCERMLQLADSGSFAGVRLADVPPRVVVEHVIPIIQASLSFVGDDANTDVILMLLERAVEMNALAVPLTIAIMQTLRKASSLSIQELFWRVDASTLNVPFLYYYTLCYARDRGLVSVVEHLCSVWHADSVSVLRRAPHLAPPYKLWQCSGCGRLNSDRFNYCLCSSLRNGFVVCTQCGYGQDERWPSCLQCGATRTKETTPRAFGRRMWTCGSCHASNPARQTLLCFRCGRPTGPQIIASLGSSSAGARSFCRCTGKDEQRVAYDFCVGVCRDCGQFVSQHAALSTLTWQCVGCGSVRSSLERSCPSCPQVACLPFAMGSKVSTRRYCAVCGEEEANAFASCCSHCGCGDFGKERRTDTPRDGDENTLATRQVDDASNLSQCENGCRALDTQVLVCSQCGWATVQDAKLHQNTSANENALIESPSVRCEECAAEMSPDRDLVRSCQRRCPSCNAQVPATDLGVLCAACGAFVPPTAWRESESAEGLASSGGWSAACLQQTFTHLRRLTSSLTDQHHPTPVRHKLEAIRGFLDRFRSEWRAAGSNETVATPALHRARVGVLVEANLVLQDLNAHIAQQPSARRAAALLKQVMTSMDERCGFAGQASHFSAEEVCHECLGGHPAELCRHWLGTWECAECGASQANDDIGRYLCIHCFTLRPCVQDLFPSECWECSECSRVNVEFETYCIHCDAPRPSTPLSRVLLHGESNVRTNLSPQGTASASGETTAGDSAGRDDVLARATSIPFLPTQCALCKLVHLEAACPLCTNYLPDVVEAKGVVCDVGKRHAYIQPVGTHRLEDRIFVSEEVLRETPLQEGKEVFYSAELRRRNHGAGFQATRVTP